MEFEKTQDPSNPLYFFQHTQNKWVKYGGKWYNPEEWEGYYPSRPIDPEVEWYHDPLELLQQWQDELSIEISPYLLQQYFELSTIAIRYYRNKATRIPQPGQGRGV